ncbi:MAG TPA: APC family permease [Blastocatellia bacterium]|nr:APC family permease [Blastocatellia bacterium]
MTTSSPQSLTAGAHAEKSRLRRVMGLRDLVLFYIIAVVGLRWMPTAATLGPSALALWLLCFACFFLPLAFTVAELSSRYPEEGGIYVWVKQTCGDFQAFITGWAYWMTNIFVFPAVLLFGASNVVHAVAPRAAYASSKSLLVALAFLAIVIAITLNIVGLNVARWLHNAGGLLGNWLTAAILIVMGMVAWLKFGPATDFHLPNLKPKLGSLSDILLLSNMAFAFAGLESASSMSEEVRDPKRNIPRALLLAGASITFIYVVGTVSLLLALPQDKTSQLVGITDAIRVSGERTVGAGFGAGLGTLSGLLLFISETAGLSAWMAAIARLPFAVGLDGLLPRAFTRLHPRWHTPYVALLFGGGGIGLLLIASLAGQQAEQAYRMLVSLGVILYFIPYLYLFAALIRSQRQPAAEGVIRVPGGRGGAYVVGATGFLVTALSIVLACLPGKEVEDRAIFFIKIFGAVGITLLAGAVVYALGRRRVRACEG